MGKSINELQIGDKSYIEKTISETDVYLCRYNWRFKSSSYK